MHRKITLPVEDLSNSPKIMMTQIWREFDMAIQLCEPEALYTAVMGAIQKDLAQSLQEELQRIQQDAEDMVIEYYPEKLSDEELIWLSYRLPMPVSLAILRYRLVRGLALRELANKGLMFGPVESADGNSSNGLPTQKGDSPIAGSAFFTEQAGEQSDRPAVQEGSSSPLR